MKEQYPCANCLCAIPVDWSDFLACSKDNCCHVGITDCENFISKKDLHQRAEEFRKMINSLTDEQLAFLYFR